MTSTYTWQRSYRAALLETEWTKMHERIQAAEAEIYRRKCLLSGDHKGTAEEREAIDAAVNGLNVLRKEAREWLDQQRSRGATAQLD